MGREICCHNLAALLDPDVFNLEVRLVQPHEPSSRLKAFLKAYMGMDARSHVRTSIEAKLARGGSCKCGDVVLIKSIDGINITAGKVCFHLDGCFGLVSIVLMYTPLEHNLGAGSIIWETADAAVSVVQLPEIIAPVIYNELGGGRIRTLLPWDFRKRKAMDA